MRTSAVAENRQVREKKTHESTSRALAYMKKSEYQISEDKRCLWSAQHLSVLSVLDNYCMFHLTNSSMCLIAHHGGTARIQSRVKTRRSISSGMYFELRCTTRVSDSPVYLGALDLLRTKAISSYRGAMPSQRSAVGAQSIVPRVH